MHVYKMKVKDNMTEETRDCETAKYSFLKAFGVCRCAGKELHKLWVNS